MTDSPLAKTRIVGPDALRELRAGYHRAGKRVVTTNGCFDLLHPGHVEFLEAARALGDVLIVGLNSDASTHRLKGPGRPLFSEQERATMLLALKAVDHVVVFDEQTPLALLAEIQPDIHCKAADYDAEALPEAETVRQHGGEVRILPLSQGYSTSRLLERIAATTRADAAMGSQEDAGDRRSLIIDQLLAGSNVLRQTAYRLNAEIEQAAAAVTAALMASGRVLFCGNGGSAADAQHAAGELAVRFRRERRALAGIALTTDTSVLTAAGNDYGFDHVFSRQVEALGRPGDVLFALSTSGHSANVLAAVEAARQGGLYTVGLTGSRPSPLSDIVDLCLAVPSEHTPFIQQAHMSLLHTICDLVEQAVVEASA